MGFSAFFARMQRELAPWTWRMRNMPRRLFDAASCIISGKIRKPAIGLVVGSFDKGGLEQVVLNLYKQYRNFGYDAYILVQENCVGSLAQYVDNPSHIHIFVDREDFFLKFCRQKRISILHYHYNTFLLDKARLYGFYAIYTIHNVYTWLNDEDFIKRSKAMLHSNQLVAVSTFVRNYFCARAGVEFERVSVIPNGIDFDEMRTGFRPLLSRNDVGVAGDDFVFVHMASYHRVKHHKIIIGALERIKKTNVPVKVLFVGNVGDPYYHASVQEEIASSPASDSIRLIQYMERAQIGLLLRDIADAFLLPSIQEGCSNAVLEALFCGLPMILTNVGSAAEILSGASGILIAPPFDDLRSLSPALIHEISESKNTRNVDDLAQAMLELATNKAAYRQKAQEKAIFSREFTAEAMAHRYLSLLK